MILTTGSEASTRVVYDKLVALARGGFIPRSTLLDSYDRILTLKAGL
jgi:hypoxanthine phosphoribosyltransferase